MRILETLYIIWINLMENKVKVLLTSLGIIVGAATIVMVIAIGKGGENAVKAQFNDLSVGTLYINPDYSKGPDLDFEKIPRLTLEDTEKLVEECPSVAEFSLRSNGFIEVTLGGEKEYLSVSGATDNYAIVSNLPLQEGENFTEEDIEANAKVAVIGDGLAKKYFGGADSASGQQISMGGKKFTVIGVLERKGDGMQGMNPDDTIYIPLTTGQKYLFSKDQMTQVVGLADDIETIPQAVAEIRSGLDYILEQGSDLLTVEDAGSRIKAATASARTMSMLLVSVAVIVFIVGGIGIMNVLFVSVKERTKEIGILKALGSSRRDILLQFLLESLAISLFGGLVGVLVSCVIMPLMKYTDLAVAPSVSGLLIALFFALITGTVFGFYPALQASRLKPIDALNYE